jgi:hypothetical protein
VPYSVLLFECDISETDPVTETSTFVILSLSESDDGVLQ